MKTTDTLKLLLNRSQTTDTTHPPYDFGLISRYFYNRSVAEKAFQYIDAETTSDLDLNAVFERIDHTASKIGQQYLYARIRTLEGPDQAKAFNRRTEAFEKDPHLAERCKKHLSKLSDDGAYDLQNLIYDTPPAVNGLAAIYALSAASLLSLALVFIHPLFLLLFAGIFAVNLYLHYSNKIHITLCLSSVKQLARGIQTAERLAGEKVPGAERIAAFMPGVRKLGKRSRMATAQGDGGNDFAAIVWLFLELVKIAFNVETILYHRYIQGIDSCREDVHALFRFIGETDSAISVMQLRSEVQTCRPEFSGRKMLHITDAVHPLIENCTANTLTLDGTSLLLTGSNMSGKTTFIRTLMLNLLLGQTICTCFAKSCEAPYLKLYSSIRIADDIEQGTSYYLQEVLTIKRFIEASGQETPCLFALDELFKGTNTTERIAAGKAVLARLNKGPHIVLVSTHDTELTTLLRDDGYELHHFREEVAGGKLRFDYRLHAGRLTTRNAIRILELYHYPPEVIDDAYRTQQHLLQKKD